LFLEDNGRPMSTRLFLLLFSAQLLAGPVYRIETIAGSSNAGDGQPATQAQLSDAQGLALDRAGNLYIADPNNHRVRRVNASGIIETIAGTGVAGFSGDGGPGNRAQLSAPYGVAVDGTGVVYVADYGNRRVRRIGLDGRISTIAGTGHPGTKGDGGQATSAELAGPRNIALDSAGNVFIADFDASLVRKIDVQGVISTFAGSGTRGFAGDGQSALIAQLSGPAGLHADSTGSLYIADSGNGRIRKVSGGLITSWFNGDHTMTWVPTGIAFDAAGAAYIADAGGLRIVRVDPAGAARIVAGTDGPLGAIRLDTARDVALDASGNILIADGARVRRIAPDGTATVVAGDGTFGFRGDGGKAIDAALNSPSGIAAAPDGSLLIADTGNHRIRKVSADGNITTIAGTKASSSPVSGRPAIETPLFGPTGLTLDGNGVLWFAESSGHRIRLLTQTGAIATAAGNGTAGFDSDILAIFARINTPVFAINDGAGNIYIADSLNHRVRKFIAGGAIANVAGNGTAGYTGDGGAALQASLNTPRALAFDSKGNLYIADSGNNRVRVVSRDGNIRTFAGSMTPLSNPRGLTVSPGGTVFIADTGNHRILAVDGTEVREIAGRGVAGYGASHDDATKSELNAPSALALDSQGNLYVADEGNHRVCKLTPRNVTDPPIDPATEPKLTISLVHAASLESGPVAPGELIRVLGEKIGPAETVASTFGADGVLPEQLADTQVLFDGLPAKLLLASSNAVHVQVPYRVAGKTSTVVELRRKGQAIATVTVDVVRAAPGVFTAEGGKGAALALNADGSMNASWNPAIRGTFLSLFATGEGLTTPDGIDGKPASVPLPKPVLPVWVQIGGKPAEVLFAGAAPGMVGVLQVNVKLAPDLPAGDVPVRILIGPAASQDQVSTTLR
jgi:uncharacterized protein (TIGR03437 family)